MHTPAVRDIINGTVCCVTMRHVPHTFFTLSSFFLKVYQLHHIVFEICFETLDYLYKLTIPASSSQYSINDEICI